MLNVLIWCTVYYSMIYQKSLVKMIAVSSLIIIIHRILSRYMYSLHLTIWGQNVYIGAYVRGIFGYVSYICIYTCVSFGVNKIRLKTVSDQYRNCACFAYVLVCRCILSRLNVKSVICS